MAAAMSAGGETMAAERPPSDVSSAVGFVGLAGLLAWIVIARQYPAIADLLGLPAGRGVLSGSRAALAGLLASAVPMVLWSVLVEKVHLRASTGLDWRLKRPWDETIDWSITKLAGLWATWALLCAFYWLGAWYWQPPYGFAMQVLGWLVVPLFAGSIPYVIWLDRHLVNPRDACWHFGAMLVGREAWESDAVKRHLRAWFIKGFFGAFMIAILPDGFRYVVEADLSSMLDRPVRLALFLISLLFVFDVQIGTVGYLLTMKPLDAHIRSGNPFLAGWIAALVCYPPLMLMDTGDVLDYRSNAPGWLHWFAGHDALALVWAVWLVFLTAIYAWATVIFGLRFSNLTYRGVITNGPFRWTRHPAYLSKNLFWWCAVLPFLVTSGSVVEGLRNALLLGAVSAIYYWRARTEEAHLLLEDAKYREFYAWMGEYGLVTSRLRRLGQSLARRGGAS
ncbi:DUF1295 domain-containing protein [Altererythrobacter halimionae]|uniref:DUF1295 domain-containing protein n=2 Tax=Alteriqipengyuania halimionae TaxID=1926630 RepID=A0A6I4U326_9SPHN|nr:DUF1295 domain-containing protein [Alteriqipengyuania halimionae]